MEIEKKYEPSLRDLLPQVIASCISFGIVIQAGANMVYSAVLTDGLSSNQTDITIDDAQTPWIASLVTIGTPIGSLVAGPLMDKYGRKKMCAVSCLPIILSWILLVFTKSIEIVYVARILAGIAGGLTTVSLVYTMEITHPKVRSMLLCFNSIAVALGILLICFFAMFFNWRHIAIIFSILNICILILIILRIPESPYWLTYFGSGIHDERYKKIDKSLQLLNPRPEIYEQEYSRIQEVSRQRQQNKGEKLSDIFLHGNWRIITKPTFYKPFLLLFIIIICQQLSGTYVVIFYAISIFREPSGTFQKDKNVYDAFLWLGIVRFITSIITAILSQTVGRRVICIISGIGMTVSSLTATVHLRVLSAVEKDSEIFKVLNEQQWIWWCIILIFVCVSSFGFAVIPWTLIGELLPISVRGIGGGFTVSFAYLLMFLVLQFYRSAISIAGMYNVFLFFGIMSTIGTVIIYFFLPETHRKNSIEIEEYFSKT